VLPSDELVDGMRDLRRQLEVLSRRVDALLIIAQAMFKISTEERDRQRRERPTPPLRSL
jgi:hypothetical protein